MPLPILYRLLPPLLAISLSTTAMPCAAAFDWWPFGRKTEADTGTVPDPLPYTAALTVTGADSRLEKALRNESGLIENEKKLPSGLSGLIARARQDIARLTTVLYENARYAGQIAITIDGRPLDTIGPFDPIENPPVPVAITVNAGPPFAFGRIQTAPLPLDVSLAKLGLVSGRPAGSAVIVSAETAIANGWRLQGHPLVTVNPREVVADHASSTLDVALRIDEGPLANFGRVEITGIEHVDASLPLRRAGIERELYSSKKLDEPEKMKMLA
ncbi:MAG: hypothetical protein ABI831_00670, partial [Betaproteobacteria bacterium]